MKEKDILKKWMKTQACTNFIYGNEKW
jgi:hypothetical protein